MISPTFIQQLAKKLQTTELNIRREYIQHVFLSYFYQHPHTNKIYFKGGTALRIIYNSPRFSEDLDFSSSPTIMRTFEDILVQTLNEIEREGIKTEIKESKKTTGGYLTIVNFNLGDQEVAIRLEISERDEIKNGEAMTIVNDFIPPYSLIAMTQKVLVEGKIQALMARQKARDFYDLYFILRARLLSAKAKNILSKVKEIVVKTDLNFGLELKGFLPKSHWPILKNFRKVLEQEIDRST